MKKWRLCFFSHTFDLSIKKYKHNETYETEQILIFEIIRTKHVNCTVYMDGVGIPKLKFETKNILFS